MKFRKRPVVIEAVQFTGDNLDEIRQWAADADIEGPPPGMRSGSVLTLEGRMRFRPSDWIIRGVAGEYYPCQADIFAETYEEAPE